MIIMFRVLFDSISKYEVTRTSDKSVWYKNSRGTEGRDLRKTTHYSWFDTFEEAKEFVVKKADLKYNSLVMQLCCAAEKLEEAKNLTKGDE